MTDDRTWFTNDQNLAYRFNNGVPNQLTESISPWVNDARAAWDGLFVQEQWTHRRLTLQAALRFDRSSSWFPEQQEGPSRFLPAPIVVPETRGVDGYKDLAPRIGVAYDLSGTGRTALKMNVGKYLEGVGVSGTYANTNPTLRMPQTTSMFGTAGVTRAWTDANGNLTPDCDLLNPGAQDLRPSGGDLCGVISNTSFGRNVLTSNFAAGTLGGWGVRPSDWNVGLSIQQQIGTKSSVEVTYTRRTYNGFFVADNLALQPSDLTPFSIVGSRRPPAAGRRRLRRLRTLRRRAREIRAGGQPCRQRGPVRRVVAVLQRRGRDGPRPARQPLRARWRLEHGADRRRQLRRPRATAGARDDDDRDERVRRGAERLGGDAREPVLPRRVRVAHAGAGLTSYVVPKAEVELSATFQSKPGAMLAANYAAPNSAVAPSLGRNLSGNAANVTVNLVAPGEMYGDRINQLDLRVGKTLKLGPLADEAGAGRVQRAQLQRGPDLQQRVRSRRDVAAADDDPDAAVAPVLRGGRLLMARAPIGSRSWRRSPMR